MIDVTAIQKRSKKRLSAPTVKQPQGLNEVQGFTGFYIGASITDMREWSPERIYSFFEGIAKVIRARGNVIQN